MTKLKRYHLKNEMLLANLLANFIAVAFFQVLMFRAEPDPPEHIWQIPAVEMIDILFTPAAFIFVWVMTLRYERPIRKYLDARFAGQSVSQDLEATARRKVLNEPYVLIGLDLSMWLLSAIVYSCMWWILDVGSYWIHRSVFVGLSTGFITVTLAFFLLEHVLQKRLAPYFFPEGELSRIPKTLRIRIRTRLVALLFACNLIPLFSILHIFYRITGTEYDPAIQLNILRSAIFVNASIFVIAGFCLTVLVSRNLTQPFGEIVQTLRQIRNGRFDKKVQVTTNDEIGYTGDAINEMTEGLKERERLQQSLDIAMEVQQNLLPAQDPQMGGLDIAGTSIYCEETGGDYYDYLMTGEKDQKKVCVVVGDVADHGIPSALLMTTARAFLRQRTSRSGELDQVVYDVNRQLTRDVEDSGRFMTLFICEIDRDHQVIHWVNAGHDPAMIYDPAKDRFEELTGNALPLGVSEKAAYQKFDKKIGPGQIIMIGTDGIWEAQSPEGEMFGKERFKDIIRQQADRPAKAIIQTVIDAVDRFCHPLAKTDDVTLVVAKIT
ncbi:MAG: SpoIIE family protein phosphatase [Desulfobacterales bacterium]|jgi:sigma-B regulation protein RsbU (phosphoserine phosphatase)